MVHRRLKCIQFSSRLLKLLNIIIIVILNMISDGSLNRILRYSWLPLVIKFTSLSSSDITMARVTPEG